MKLSITGDDTITQKGLRDYEGRKEIRRSLICPGARFTSPARSGVHSLWRRKFVRRNLAYGYLKSNRTNMLGCNTTRTYNFIFDYLQEEMPAQAWEESIHFIFYCLHDYNIYFNLYRECCLWCPVRFLVQPTFKLALESGAHRQLIACRDRGLRA